MRGRRCAGFAAGWKQGPAFSRHGERQAGDGAGDGRAQLWQNFTDERRLRLHASPKSSSATAVQPGFSVVAALEEGSPTSRAKLPRGQSLPRLRPHSFSARMEAKQRRLRKEFLSGSSSCSTYDIAAWA